MRTLVLALLLAAPAAAASNPKKGTALKLPAGALLEPKALAQRLAAAKAGRPVPLYVGFPETYKLGHIAGSPLLGPASREDGLARLLAYVKALPKDAPLVVYCGCCPWKYCPNVQPAYAALRARGFSNVKVLRLEHAFGEDWTGAGLPAETGPARD